MTRPPRTRWQRLTRWLRGKGWLWGNPRGWEDFPQMPRTLEEYRERR